MYRRILLQVFILLIISPADVWSQPDPDGGLELQVRLAPEFEAVNLENLITLTFSNQNNRPVLQYEISNPEGSGVVEFLMDTRIMSEGLGTILESTQNPSTRLRIGDGQTMRFTNIDIIWGTISGQAARPRFDFTLTSEGRNLLNKLNSGAVPDADVFYVEVQLRKAGDTAGSSDLLVASELELETDIPRSYQAIDADPANQAFLENLNLDEEIPEFRWAGPDNQRYRLIVVSGSGSEEAAGRLNSRFAQSFDPSRFHEPEQEILLDVMTGNRFFIADNDLAGIFEPGSEYYWQVATTVTTVRSEREIRSDVWSFSTMDPVMDELISLLSFLLGEERVQQMIEDGYELDVIELGGVTYTAEEAVPVLREMQRRIQNRRATIGE
jgi:hypothetical protein